MELGVRQIRWHEKFHGIPWNWMCANFADTSSSMEFHGTGSAPISLTRAVPWNSMEFHGTRSAPISLTRAVPWNSMEFYGTKNAPISPTRAVLWNSMELQVRHYSNEFTWGHESCLFLTNCPMGTWLSCQKCFAQTHFENWNEAHFHCKCMALWKVQHKAAVTPSIMHWSYCCLTLIHQYYPSGLILQVHCIIEVSAQGCSNPIANS